MIMCDRTTDGWMEEAERRGALIKLLESGMAEQDRSDFDQRNATIAKLHSENKDLVVIVSIQMEIITALAAEIRP